MDKFFSNIIPLLVVISIIVSIVKNINKAKAKKAKAQSGNKSNETNSTKSLRSMFQQIGEQQKAVKTQYIPKPSNTQYAPTNQIQYNQGKTLEGSNVEMQRYTHDTHISGSYNEGDKLDRSSLEGVNVEMQRHAHDAHIGGSYNEGDELNRSSLEGRDLIYTLSSLDDIDMRVKKSHRNTKRSKNSLQNSGGYKAIKMNRNSIVNGIIMAEILQKRNSRRKAQ